MTRDGRMIEPTLVIEPLPVEINKGSSEVSTMKIILNYVSITLFISVLALQPIIELMFHCILSVLKKFQDREVST